VAAALGPNTFQPVRLGMKTFKIIAVLSVFINYFSCVSYAKQADLSGKWYSSNPHELRELIDHYINDAEVEDIKGTPLGFVSPHAGIRFSGPVAGYAYRMIEDLSPELIVVIGFSHRYFFPGKVSILKGDHYETPIGNVKIDRKITDDLLDTSDMISNMPRVFASENSIEMQMPFIKASAPESRLLALCICDQKRMVCDRLADSLYGVLKDRERFVIIASSDMCHYLPYAAAVRKDRGTIDRIMRMEPVEFYNFSTHGKRPDKRMCGYGAVYTLMRLCSKLGADNAALLKYANSGDTFGGKNRVVGYMSAVLYSEKAKADRSPAENRDMLSEKRCSDEHFTRENTMFTTVQKKRLLNIARGSIEYFLENGKKPEVAVDDDLLTENMGAFVTLHKNGRLRGCIGNMASSDPLYITIRDMAIQAAFRDPRFTPLSEDEVGDIDIEISVLTPMRKTEDITEIEIPGHGVMVRKGFRSGVYLPQVAEETGWNKEEFMNSLCGHKAGIGPDDWQTGNCEIYTFRAEVFGEKTIAEK
jgi:hypothetical protein